MYKHDTQSYGVKNKWSHMCTQPYASPRSRNSLWTPHVYLVNEQESVVMGADKKDILLTVEPDGTVVLSSR